MHVCICMARREEQFSWSTTLLSTVLFCYRCPRRFAPLLFPASLARLLAIASDSLLSLSLSLERTRGGIWNVPERESRFYTYPRVSYDTTLFPEFVRSFYRDTLEALCYSNDRRIWILKSRGPDERKVFWNLGTSQMTADEFQF